ncbi:MAG: sugar phosphate nucleotidyltransferase [candidate division WOR-3 bacterium]|jgi:bifunctional UDP-N-acetylglucosamine pyrophosphorylase/glucosamine-1-phosphate N-acetyltransferase
MERYPLSCIILAGGKSKRMKSKKSKVLHKLCGKPIIYYPLKACKSLLPDEIYIVIGQSSEGIKEIINDDVIFVYQNEPLGTGHAVMQVVPYLKDKDMDVLIVPADAPLIRIETIKELYKFHKENDALVSILTTQMPDPTGYGRIIRSSGNRVLMIVEEADAFPEEKQIKEVNSGIYIFESNILIEALNEIKPDNKQGEYYLTDVIAIIQRKYGGVYAYKIEDWKEILGINTREQLSLAHSIMQERIIKRHMENGVSIIMPNLVYIEDDVIIEPDVIIYPFVSILGNSYISEDCEIGPNVILENYKTKKGEVIRNAYLKG